MSDTPATLAEQLAAIPGKYANPPANLTSKLPKPTKKDNAKGKCDECGGWHGLPAVHLDYMGHADVTLALIEIDPEFDYGWLTQPDGSMLIKHPDTGRLVLEGWLIVHGQRRLCVGTCEASKMEPEKELIGDLLRNGAMRFGVATGLWSKSDAHESQDRDRGDQPPRQRSRRRTQGSNEPPRDAPPDAEPVDPLILARARGVFEFIRDGGQDLQDDVREMRGDRSLKVPDLVADPEWLATVESYLEFTADYEPPKPEGEYRDMSPDEHERAASIAEQKRAEAERAAAEIQAAHDAAAADELAETGAS